jgi:transcriptional regulator with PAS, ATPase and Fis domain
MPAPGGGFEDLVTFPVQRPIDASFRAETPSEVEAAFRSLVRSPLRAGILRLLGANPHEVFDVESLMSTFGCLRVDIDNCLLELTRFGVVRRVPGSVARYALQRVGRPAVATLVDRFLERHDSPSTEEQAPSVQRFKDMIGRDEKMLVVFEWIRTAAKSDIAVLILGPTGSGKEVVARMIHELSRRSAENLQAVNCAALPDTLFESELFGYEKGAFTGAYDRKPGRLELANRGTLFLDEIGDLSLLAQAKLLRVLEDRRVERLGSQRPIDVDFRLISATNRPLDHLVRDERFREDLFYRVNAFAIRLPSLRERPGDIPLLADRFLARYCTSNGLPLDARLFSAEAISRLQSYSWPGNIRELESTVSRAALSSSTRVIDAGQIDFLHPHASQSGVQVASRLPTLADAERAHIAHVLDAVSWNKKEAARVLDISRGTLYRKIAEYGLNPPAPARFREAS